jgi:hypothetical protein
MGQVHGVFFKAVIKLALIARRLDVRFSTNTWAYSMISSAAAIIDAGKLGQAPWGSWR